MHWGASFLLVSRDLLAPHFDSLAHSGHPMPPLLLSSHPTHHLFIHTIPPPGHLDTDLCLLNRTSYLPVWWLTIV